MLELPKGYTITTKKGETVVVDSKLGEGGVGAVYQVAYGGQLKALKWYSGAHIRNPEKFYANLENNIKKEKPADAFLWPEDITEHDGAAFGYIMDLRPGDYKDFSRFLLGKEGFASVTAMTNASLHITAAFRSLHQRGCSYQDLNSGNFFINPNNGDVLICDNDNVSEYGKNSGIAGTARYMAPEIVAKGALPGINTDKYSLSVVLFFLWVKSHPLEGKAACPPCMTAEYERIIYGKNPVFIWDPDDKSNRPVEGIHLGAISNWPSLPKYLRDTFTRAFSKEALNDPSCRIIEQEWLRLFIRLRSEVFKCPCGEVYFADPAEPNPCPKCGEKNSFPLYINANHYNIPVHQNTKLYACHTVADSDDFKQLTGEVLTNGKIFAIKNASSKNWTLTDGGVSSPIAPGSVAELKKGALINFGGMDARIV